MGFLLFCVILDNICQTVQDMKQKLDTSPAIKDQDLVGSTFHKGKERGGGRKGKGKTFPRGFFTVGFSPYDMIAEPLHYILSWYLIQVRLSYWKILTGACSLYTTVLQLFKETLRRHNKQEQ